MPAQRHVLIAEADSRVRSLLSRIVTRTYSGITITAVTNGATAFTVYEEIGADLLITAHRLPILSGLSLVRALRALDVTIPILVISSDPIEAAAWAMGATHLLALLPMELEAGEAPPPADG
jgi:DNA-binding response OmpR family regulator